MKKILILLLLTSVVQAKTIKIKDPGNYRDIQPNAQLMVDSAIAGDELLFPEGVFIVNKSIIIKKFISVRGCGLNRTILYRSESVKDSVLSKWESILVFNINSTESSNIVVSGICFKSKIPSIAVGDKGSLVADFGINMIYCKDFKITKCRFENFGDGAIIIRHDDSLVGGLICKNEFYHNQKGVDGLGLGYGVVIYGANKKWVVDPELGSSKFIFVEDNIFDFHRHSIAAGGCAKYVFRYNTVLDNAILSSPYTHAIDAHPGRFSKPGTENYYGTRAIEVYDNSIINSKFYDLSSTIPGQSVSRLVETCIGISSGDALVYKNYIKGYRFGGAVSTLFKSGTGKVYYWGNIFDVYNFKCQDFYNFQPAVLKEGIDYQLSEYPYTPYTYPHPNAK